MKYVIEVTTLKQTTRIIPRKHVLLAYTCSIFNKGFSRKDNMKRHEEKCNDSSSGAGTKCPPTRENDNMVLDKRTKSNPFTIQDVSSALQDSVCRWKIDYPEDLEEADIHNTLHASIHSMKTTIQ